MSKINGKVLKHCTATRSMHWLNLICFVILGLTGIGFYWNIAGLLNIFGGPGLASEVHRWTAIVFVTGPALYILLYFDHFAKFIDTISSFTKDDIAWLKTMGGYIPFIKADNPPPQDKFNAGQKILGGLIIIGCLLLILTGFPMWLGRHAMAPATLSTCYNIHFWTAIIMFILIAGHFFLAAIHPKSRVEFGCMMLDGYVDAELTAHHNLKWFRELNCYDEAEITAEHNVTG